MKIIKCDKCRKIKREEKYPEKDKWVSGLINAGSLFFHSFDLCEKCGKPLMKYLRGYLNLRNKAIK